MAALYDGTAYLVEQYAIALAPGLQLTHPQALAALDVKALAAGLTAARQRFIPLPHVQAELTQLQATVDSEILLNEQFTAAALERQANNSEFAVLHLATHGEFSSQADETFILAWDRKILVQELDTVLRDRDLTQPNPLELLVLSACETATGDLRAALGLAGVAVRAGARSTLASLWTIPDESTAILMSEFYQALVTPGMSRAKALQQAQLALLRSPAFQRPRHWAPFVLLGSWL
jgi:CHAT domain-containing protein